MPITVKRLSDNKTHVFGDMNPETRVHHVKGVLKKEFAPANKNGCRLIYQGKVMKSLHKLKSYGVPDNGTVEMDDRKNWSSSSSSSDSED